MLLPRLLPLLLLLPLWGMGGDALFAQFTLTGTLTDAATGDPVGFATVYLDGTSVGDVSADDGTFQLKVPAGRQRSVLVVSHLNYQALMTNLTSDSRNLSLRLVAKANELTSIEVEDADRRAENLAEFRKSMIGKDNWAKRVEIHNDEIIHFNRDFRRKTLRNVSSSAAELIKARNLRDPEWSDGGKTVTYSAPSNLQATTDGPLKVLLKDLGYELHIDLSAFTLDYQSRQMSYLGSSLYLPLEDASTKEQKRYERNRIKAYYGSSMHFIRSLLADSLAENGFQVVEVIQEPSATRPQEIKRVNLRDHLRMNKEGNYLLMGLSENQYAILYHGTRHAPRADPRLRESPNVLQSRMFLVGLSGLIYPNGTLGDTNLVFSGDIGDRKLAWSLPSDYYPPVITKKKQKAAKQKI